MIHVLFVVVPLLVSLLLMAWVAAEQLHMRPLRRRAEAAHADYVLTRARRLLVDGVDELESEARRIEADGERAGRYGYTDYVSRRNG